MSTPAGVVVEKGSECIFAHTGPRENKETFTKNFRTRKHLQNWRTSGERESSQGDTCILRIFHRPARHCGNKMAAALCLWGVELLPSYNFMKHEQARVSSYTYTIDTCILPHNRYIHIYTKALPEAAQCESNKEKSFI